MGLMGLMRRSMVRLVQTAGGATDLIVAGAAGEAAKLNAADAAAEDADAALTAGGAGAGAGDREATSVGTAGLTWAV